MPNQQPMLYRGRAADPRRDLNPESQPLRMIGALDVVPLEIHDVFTQEQKKKK